VRVRERTAELTQANQELHAEMAKREQAQAAHSFALRRLVEAQETERSRISRELHDQMGQELTALKLALNVLKQELPAASPARNGAGRLEQLANSLMGNVHRLAWELRPAILDDFGLPLALRRYAAEWAERTRITLDFHGDAGDSRRLAPNAETMLYRIAQEALTNVVRHARATRVSVLLEDRPDHKLLIIEDDGQGFDLEAALTNPGGRCLGLLGMQERIMLIGGTMNIETGQGRGTTLFVRVPLAATAPAGTPP
jgi:signal transduction histidine kinase